MRQVKTPIVEMDGDEMTRVLWADIKKRFIHPYLDIDLRYFDLGLPYRDQTNDQVVRDAIEAIREFGVGIKCATINPDKARREEFQLKNNLPSANGLIRNAFGGTVFREPVVIARVPPLVRTWTKPIVIGRHAFGDQYSGKDLVAPGPGTLEMVYTPENADEEQTRIQVFRFEGPGIAQTQLNTDDSILKFAHTSFRLALSRGLPLYVATKNNVMKQYDGRFVAVFKELYETQYEPEFKKQNIWYEHRLIDDMVAYMMKSEGGFILSLKSEYLFLPHTDKKISMALFSLGRLRWRCPIRSCRSGLRISRPHDLCSHHRRRQSLRERSRPWHSYTPFSRVPKRGEDLHKSYSDHFCLDAWADPARQTR